MKKTAPTHRNRVDLVALIAMILSIPVFLGYLIGNASFDSTVFLPSSEGKEDLAVSAQPFGKVLDSVYQDAKEAFSVSAEHAALMTLDGTLLYGKGENDKAGMASTTKIMTAYLAAVYIEEVGRDACTVVSENSAGIEGSSVYLKVGEEVRLIDLLYATLLASANDAAAALAEAVSGDIPTFVEEMNRQAEAWGLIATHFENPHGLADDTHYTTAYELGIIACHAMRQPLFAQVVGTKNYTFAGEDMTRSLSNHNRMLYAYEGALGVKTGFTRSTGRCLVTAAEQDGVTLIAVSLNAPDDWQDHRVMLDHGFSVIERKTLAEVGSFAYTLPVVGARQAEITLTNSTAAYAVLPKEHGEITHSVELPAFLYAPLQKGDTAGQVVFYENGTPIATLPLVAEEGVEALTYEKTWQERLKSFLGLS